MTSQFRACYANGLVQRRVFTRLLSCGGGVEVGPLPPQVSQGNRGTTRTWLAYFLWATYFPKELLYQMPKAKMNITCFFCNAIPFMPATITAYEDFVLFAYHFPRRCLQFILGRTAFGTKESHLAHLFLTISITNDCYAPGMNGRNRTDDLLHADAFPLSFAHARLGIHGFTHEPLKQSYP